jgi:xanthine dehydrogenase YagS FAD-binding subunit
MHPFTLERPRDLAAALALHAQAGRTDAPIEYIAGGTDMVQLLQEYVRVPERLVSLAGLLDRRIEVGPQGLRLGAAATMAEVAAHPAVVQQFPVIAAPSRVRAGRSNHGSSSAAQGGGARC